MRKLKIYLDTSIINFAIDDRNPEGKKLTLRLFEEIKAGKYEAFISRVVLFEVNKADDEKRKKLLEVIRNLNPEELPINEEIQVLAKKYVSSGIIPEKYADDAIHIAAACVHDLDVIISWNFEHIVKLRTKQEVVGVNAFMGYRKDVEIYSPQEVVEDV
ncbi:MAG: PIN domain-containing protein [Candidatus Firestonebacteria bacterium]